MSLLQPFTHDVLKETVRSLPQHRVTIISRSMCAVKDTVQFLRSSEQSETRHRTETIFKNKYSNLIEQKRGEWPTQATMLVETPALVHNESVKPVTILDGEVEIDGLMLDAMANELADDTQTSQPQDTNVIDLARVRATIGVAAAPAAEAQRHLVEVTRPEGAAHDISKAA